MAGIRAQYPNAQCRPEQNSAWLAADVDAAPFDSRSCVAYSCQTRAIDQVLARSAALSFMANGGVCSPVAGQGSFKEFASNADETNLIHAKCTTAARR